MVEVRYYVAENGRSPFEDWFASVESSARARVATAIARLEQGNTSNLKSVGSGVHELRMDFGPRYRLYLGPDGPTLVILLIGGTKNRQQQDIETAKGLWEKYKRSKHEKSSPKRIHKKL